MKAAFACVVLGASVSVLVGCARDAEDSTAESAPSESQTTVESSEVQRVLASAGTAVSSVEIGGDTCGGALEAFTDQYGSEAGQEGMVFSVVDDESDQTQLSRNMPACVVYVPDLLRDISGPVGPDGNGPTPQMAVTADIGFYEPTTAKFVLKMEVQTG
jgi:hypothetical protein